MKIVMVDDSAADRKLLQRLLRTAGGEVEFHEAVTASGGLSACREFAPDCVLVDYKLPGVSGLDFLRRLRAAEDGEGPVAVVMLTALVSEQIAVDAMKAGAQDYLVKDRITAEGLRLAVGKAVEKAGLERTLKRERDRLAQSVAEKEILIKEVHHRVKNNLQVIASLLRLQADAVADKGKDTGADRAVADALRRSQHRVESMAQIHEQLYQSSVGQVELARQAGMLLSHLLDAYGVDSEPGAARVVGRVEIAPLAPGAPLVLGVNAAIPTGLILNELISNALKHAFVDGRAGVLTISGGVCAGSVVIEVRDNGVGVPEDVDIRNPRSLGLQIVGILTRQLKGAVEMWRAHAAASGSTRAASPGSQCGSTFVVSFPERNL
jgi:two-component sensor histidine kinase/CheY-like chemotaxis protein